MAKLTQEEVDGGQCKNKFGNLKEKWRHWIILSETSGFGWREDLQRFVAADSICKGMGKSYPRIIGPKTHVTYTLDRSSIDSDRSVEERDTERTINNTQTSTQATIPDDNQRQRHVLHHRNQEPPVRASP